MRKEKGVLYELGLGFGAQTVTSCELVISTIAAKSRVLSCGCMSRDLAFGPNG
jgi:hypothetical protein